MALELLAAIVLAAIARNFAPQVPDQRKAFLPDRETVDLVLSDGIVRRVRYIAGDASDLAAAAAAGASWARALAPMGILALIHRVASRV